MQDDMTVTDADANNDSDPTDKSPRKLDIRVWLYIAAGVALIVLVVAAVYLQRDGSSADGTGGDDSAATAEASGTPGVSDGTSGTIDGPGALDPANPNANPSSGGPASQNGETPPPTSSGPVEQKLAPEGSDLTTLTAPPPKTLGLLQLPEGFTAATFTYTFSPYGWGPGGEEGGRLIVKIDKAEAASGDASKFKDYSGFNASLWVAQPLVSKVKVGGTYTGTATVRKQGDVGVLWLTELAE